MKSRTSDESGIALFLAVVAVIAFVGISFTMITSSLATSREYATAKEQVQRLYLAEAGVSLALSDLHSGGYGDVGTLKSPVSFGAGGISVASTKDDATGVITITSIGRIGESARAVRAVVREPGGIFHHAMFAGNAGGDPTYSLDLGGNGAMADEIHGDIYCGGDINVSGDAVIDGDTRASGTITGTDGKEGVSQPAPDFGSLNFETNHDVNVAAEFAANAVYQSSGQGGSAWQLPDTFASHILRLNPSDRNTENLSTTKDDYFLEDPYEAAGGASNNTRISLADGSSGAADGNGKVYFIDGNLWIHNRHTLAFEFNHLAGGSLVTFVVKGNIYFSDDLVLVNQSHDGVAFIALKDENVTDSGNVYFGDPAFGTLLRMDAFMYAENNFYDNNLQAAGSQVVEVNGIMSAGNQVAVFRGPDDNHTKLTLNFDDRVKEGKIALPGVPDFESAHSGIMAISEVTSFEIGMSEAAKAFD